LRIGNGLGEIGESRPVLEVVGAGDGKLGVLDRQRGSLNFGVGDIFGQPADVFVEEARVLAMEKLNRTRIAGTMGVEEILPLLTIGGERGGKV